MIRLSTKVGEQFRMPDIGEREVGIEIEMESKTHFPTRDVTGYYWKMEHDGSLRGEFNVEYVLRKPLKRKLAIKALLKLSTALKECNTQVQDSVRAGVHVHINVRDLTFRELWSMITCWYVLEELLTYTMCGEGRIGNHFCLGAQDADAVMFKIHGVLKGRAFAALARDDIRYSALNFVALFKYGSLEFRAMRTPKDFGEIERWVIMLLALKENSKLFPHPRHVVENFSHGGERNFLRQVLGNEDAEMVILRDPEGWEEKLRRGVRIAQEIAYARDDWDKDEDMGAQPKAELNWRPARGAALKRYKNLRQFAEEFEIKVHDNG